MGSGAVLGTAGAEEWGRSTGPAAVVDSEEPAEEPVEGSEAAEVGTGRAAVAVVGTVEVGTVEDTVGLAEEPVVAAVAAVVAVGTVGTVEDTVVGIVAPAEEQLGIAE